MKISLVFVINLHRNTADAGAFSGINQIADLPTKGLVEERKPQKGDKSGKLGLFKK